MICKLADKILFQNVYIFDFTNGQGVDFSNKWQRGRGYWIVNYTGTQSFINS